MSDERERALAAWNEGGRAPVAERLAFKDGFDAGQDRAEQLKRELAVERERVKHLEERLEQSRGTVALGFQHKARLESALAAEQMGAKQRREVIERVRDIWLEFMGGESEGGSYEAIHAVGKALSAAPPAEVPKCICNWAQGADPSCPVCWRQPPAPPTKLERCRIRDIRDEAPCAEKSAIKETLTSSENTPCNCDTCRGINSIRESEDK